MKSRFPFAKIAAALLCAAFSAVISGCGGVYLNEKYELLDGTSPISGESGSKKSSEKKYALYVADPSLYSFRNNWKSDALQGHTYYGELSESRASTLKSTFSFTSMKMTESEIQSYLTYSGESTREENITSLLGYSRGCLAFCPNSSSSVKIVLKTEDENTMELTKATDTGQLGMNIEWNNYGYVGDYVYIFVDGEYEKTASTSAGSTTIDGLTSGSHSVVLKNGNSSDAVEISNSKSVSLTLSSSLKYSLHAYNSGDGKALLTIDSYSSNAFYVWVDGSYSKQTYFMSKYASISLSSGSHTIVLKDGWSSSAKALSNSCSVYIQTGDCEGPYTLSYDDITSPNSVTLSWTGSYDGSYVYVWKDGSCIPTNRYGYSSSTITGLTAGSTYTFVLRANSTSGSPAISNSVTVTMPSSSSASYTTLDVNDSWTEGILTSGTQSRVYRFYASAGRTYTVYWADKDNGYGTGDETLDVKVSAYPDDTLTDAKWADVDRGYNGKNLSVNLSGYVYLKVEPLTSGRTGTFKIKVSN